MKFFYSLISMTLCIFSCHAEIRQVSNMEEVFPYFADADSNTLAIFDVDMVLIQPGDPAFQMANMKRFNPIVKRSMKEIPKENQMVFLSLMTISSDPVLIDKNTVVLLDKLIQRKVPCMAFTANLTGEFGKIKSMEKMRIHSLRQLGIDFSKGASYAETIEFRDLPSYRGWYSTYLDGVLFANGTVSPKGEVFSAFIEKTKLSPKKVIFIDDREENLVSLGDALKKIDESIEYLGLHFTAAQNYPSQMISEKEFESRWEEIASQAKACGP